MTQSNLSLASMLFFLATLSCSPNGNQTDKNMNTEMPALSWQTFQLYAEQNKRVVNGESIYIVEWDIPIRARDLYLYYVSRYVETTKSTVDGLSTGGDNVWSAAAKTKLTYCISSSFGANHARMRGEMARATWTWAREANVRFTYRPSEDGNCIDSNNNVEIPVQPYSGGGACAFYPSQDGEINCTSAGRALVIDIADIDSWPTEEIYGNIYPNLTTEGALRHELGHILGLRHEHIRDPDAAINNCVLEYNNPGAFRALTDYDVNSVMHYPWCNGSTTSSNQITRLDARGARSLYSSPPWIDAIL